MTDQPYTPDKYDVCSAYVDYYMRHSSALHSEVEAEFDRWLAVHDAQIKRDAAREALAPVEALLEYAEWKGSPEVWTHDLREAVGDEEETP